MSAVDKAEDLPAEAGHERSEQQKRRSMTVEKRDRWSLPRRSRLWLRIYDAIF